MPGQRCVYIESLENYTLMLGEPGEELAILAGAVQLGKKLHFSEQFTQRVWLDKSGVTHLLVKSSDEYKCYELQKESPIDCR